MRSLGKALILGLGLGMCLLAHACLAEEVSEVIKYELHRGPAVGELNAIQLKVDSAGNGTVSVMLHKDSGVTDWIPIQSIKINVTELQLFYQMFAKLDQREVEDEIRMLEKETGKSASSYDAGWERVSIVDRNGEQRILKWQDLAYAVKTFPSARKLSALNDLCDKVHAILVKALGDKSIFKESVSR